MRMRSPGRLARAVCVLMLVLPAAASSEPALPEPGPSRVRLSLAEAVARLDLGPAGAMARAELHRYEALQSRAFWAFLHDLDLSVALGYAPTCNVDPNNPALCQYQEGRGREISPYDWSSYRPTFDLRAEGTFLLYTFGKISGAREQARAGKEAAAHQAGAARSDLIQRITRAYYGVLLGQELSGLVRDARERLARELDRRKKRVLELRGSWEEEEEEDDDDGEEEEKETAQGDDRDGQRPAAGPDEEDRSLERAQRAQARVGAYLAEARALEAKARAAMRTARETLRIAVGLPPGTLVEPADTSLEPSIEKAPSFEVLLEAALGRNARLRAADAGVSAARAELGRAEAELWPSVLLRGGVRLNLTAGADCLVDPSQPAVCRDSQTGYPYAYLAMNWDLDYAKHLSRFSEARAKLDRMIAQRDGLRLLVEGELSSAYHELEERMEVLDARMDAERWTRRRRTLAASECGGLEIVDSPGSRDQSCDEEELASALRAHIEAKAARLKATFDLNLTLARLSAITGRPQGKVSREGERQEPGG